MTYCKELSSTKNGEIIFSVTSFTRIKNSKGPSTDPQVTPAFIVLDLCT